MLAIRLLILLEYNETSKCMIVIYKINRPKVGMHLLCQNNLGIIGCKRNKNNSAIIGHCNYYCIIKNLASLQVIATYFKIVDIFKIKAVVLLPKSLYTLTGLNLRPQSNISCFYGYNWPNSLLLTAFHAYYFKIVICNFI